MPIATDAATGAEVHAARFEELSPRRLYALLRLRSDVFVVEDGIPHVPMALDLADPA